MIESVRSVVNVRQERDLCGRLGLSVLMTGVNKIPDTLSTALSNPNSLLGQRISMEFLTVYIHI